MISAADLLLPSTDIFFAPIYWSAFVIAFLDVFILTGCVVPGALFAVLGGVLATFGALGGTDLVWSLFLGSFLGGLVSFSAGRNARHFPAIYDPLVDRPDTTAAAARLSTHPALAVILSRFSLWRGGVTTFAAGLRKRPVAELILCNLAAALGFSMIVPLVLAALFPIVPHVLAFTPPAAIFGVALLSCLALLVAMVARLGPALDLWLRLLSRFGRSRTVLSARTRHPALAGFVARRFDRTLFSGLPTTVLGLLFLYVFAAYVDSVIDFIGEDDVVQIDDRVAYLFYTFRNDSLISFFSFVTAAGGWRVVGTIVLGTTVALLLLGRFGLALSLWLVVIGNQCTVTLLKIFFGRARSDLGFFVETSNSFPSGHAASSIGIYGMVFYVAWRTGVLSALGAAIGAVTVASLIGLSRIYLVVHYVSDVMNGYLVGALWLVIGIAVHEWWQSGHLSRARQDRAPLAKGAVGCALVLAAWLTATIGSEEKPALIGQSANFADARALVASDGFSTQTRSFSGDEAAPLNLLLTASDVETVVRHLTDLGWSPATRPGIGALILQLWEDFSKRRPGEGVVVPTFWENRPNGLAFEKPATTPGEAPAQLRLWTTAYRLKEDHAVFLASVTSARSADQSEPESTVPSDIIAELSKDLSEPPITAQALPDVADETTSSSGQN